MTANEVIEKLQLLVMQGYGECRVEVRNCAGDFDYVESVEHVKKYGDHINAGHIKLDAQIEIRPGRLMLDGTPAAGGDLG